MYKAATLIVLLGLAAQPAYALSINTGVNASVKADVDTGIDAIFHSHSTSTDAQADADASINVSTSPVTITTSDVNETEATVNSTTEIDSEAKRDSYARGVVKADAEIKDVALSDTQVAVSHREYARLFGILPIKVYARAYVKNDGSVQVKFPWYAFASAEKSTLESDISTAVRTDVKANAKLSAKAQAEVLSKAAAAMKSRFEAEGSADATAKVQ